MSVIDKILRGAGFAPAAGSILGSFFDEKALEKVDILNGYGGIQTHFVALASAAIGYFLVKKYYEWRPRGPLKRYRFYLMCGAAVLFGLTLFLVKVSLPESYSVIADVRWQVALVLYWIFYLALGASCA